ncbi:MAG: hypothetical protein ACREK8_10395 [Gemmatimonadales bacterium]
MTASEFTESPRFVGWRQEDFVRWLAGGAVVAVLDLSFAGTYWVVIRQSTSLSRILQSIASGILGPAAFEGGMHTVWLGAALHCVVAFGWTGMFLALARNWRPFARTLTTSHGAIKTGMPFGVLVWLVMDLVVLPLSHAKPAPIASTWFVVCLVWHAIGVGLPMAVVARSYGGARPFSGTT